MIEKVQGLIINALDKTGKMKMRGLPRGLVVTLILLIVLCVLLYIAGWVYVWYYLYKVDFDAMLQLLKIITGGTFIAAVIVLTRALIDKNNNGIPDEWEEDKTKDAKSNFERHRDDG